MESGACRQGSWREAHKASLPSPGHRSPSLRLPKSEEVTALHCSSQGTGEGAVSLNFFKPQIFSPSWEKVPAAPTSLVIEQFDLSSGTGAGGGGRRGLASGGGGGALRMRWEEDASAEPGGGQGV